MTRSTPLAAVVDLPVEANHVVDTEARVGRSLGRTVTRTNRVMTGAIDALAEAASNGVLAATRRLTEEPSHATDDWGRDPMLVRNMMLLAQIRWDVATGGDQRLPKRAGALVVVNAPSWAASTVFTAFAISEAIDRPVRFVGRSPIPVLHSFDRRIGGLLEHPDEIAGALRADEIVVLGAASARGSRGVGPVDHSIIGAALATGTRIFPAGTTSSPFSRRARVEIGTPTRPPRARRGPLSELELADRIRQEIRGLLDEMGDIVTGTPLDWLPLSGIGAH
ncbi:MAG: hypothetical protein ABJH68_21175 [Ilumatobacter sp.]|uniref:hypothetical protein n=1 Tax=Ilumatobacter sp. TaxID=1967498 RepID=UPI0032982F8F